MLCAKDLGQMPVTVHIPLHEVPRRLTRAYRPPGARRSARSCGPICHLIASARRHRPQSACRRRRRDGKRGQTYRASDRLASVGGPRCRRAHFQPIPRSTRGAGTLRRDLVHVSRSGADPGEDARFPWRRQLHARPALRAHVARSRHRPRSLPAAARPGRRASSRHSSSRQSLPRRIDRPMSEGRPAAAS